IGRDHGSATVIMRTRFLFLVATVLAGQPLPPAPGARVVTVSPADRSGSEPSIAVNPKKPEQVVAAFQPASIAYSTDGGQTFAMADLTPPAGWRPGGDVSVTFDNKGRAFLCSFHNDGLGSMSYWRHGAGRNGVFVRRSLDGGKTWERGAVAVKAFPTGKEPD